MEKFFTKARHGEVLIEFRLKFCRLVDYSHSVATDKITLTAELGMLAAELAMG